MRIHLGHHFYGAGNLGDDFMLAGFLQAMASLGVRAACTACVPFPLEPLRARFPQIEWHPYDAAVRRQCISECDAWLGVGGSPFQSAQSRWFIDHLIAEQASCRTHGKPMYFLGVGVQTREEVEVPEVRALCAQAAAIWTRDRPSAERLTAACGSSRIVAAADLAHVLFSENPPPDPRPGRLCVVPNFDYAGWPGQTTCLAAIDKLDPPERIWLAQESRALPGAEKALYDTLPAIEKAKWSLVVPDMPGAPLTQAIAHWPTGAWLLSARYHAAVAGAWARARVVVIATNEKLRSAASELGVGSIGPDAGERDVARALNAATPAIRPVALAARALDACRDFASALRR